MCDYVCRKRRKKKHMQNLRGEEGKREGLRHDAHQQQVNVTSLRALSRREFPFCSPFIRRRHRNPLVRREVVRRFPTRDKIPGSTLERLSARALRGYGYCFNVFESNIDASWAREAARNETLAEQDETERPT